MKAAGESGVLCDQATYDLVGDALIFQELPAIKVKGKTQLINIYRPHMHKKKRTTTEVRAAVASASSALPLVSRSNNFFAECHSWARYRASHARGEGAACEGDGRGICRRVRQCDAEMEIARNVRPSL